MRATIDSSLIILQPAARSSNQTGHRELCCCDGYPDPDGEKKKNARRVTGLGPPGGLCQGLGKAATGGTA